jgi:hypothetical protein
MRPLSGAMLAAYRIAFAVALAAALAALGYSLLNPSADVAVLALRLIKSVVLIVISAILFRRRQRDGVAAMMALAFLLWTITSSSDLPGQSLTSPALLDRVRFVLFALALLLFPDGEWHPGWTRQVALAVAAVFVGGVAEALGLAPTHLFLPAAIACVLAAIVALAIRYRRCATPIEKQQLKWVALGLSVGVALILGARGGTAIMGRLSLPSGAPLLFETMFQVGIVVVALGFLTSLLRYRLYDAESAISRSVAFAALTLALICIFAATEAIIETLSQNYLGQNLGMISGAMAAAVAAVLFTPLHENISEWAEHYFQRDLAVLKRTLPEVLMELSGSASPAKIASAALPRIREGVQASRAALILDGTTIAADRLSRRDAQRWQRRWHTTAEALIERESSDPLFPLRMSLRGPFGSVRGWLLLGARPDGSYFSKEDLNALETIAPVLRRTLLAAREREKELAVEGKRYHALERLIADVSKRLEAIEKAR